MTQAACSRVCQGVSPSFLATSVIITRTRVRTPHMARRRFSLQKFASAFGPSLDAVLAAKNGPHGKHLRPSPNGSYKSFDLALMLRAAGTPPSTDAGTVTVHEAAELLSLQPNTLETYLDLGDEGREYLHPIRPAITDAWAPDCRLVRSSVEAFREQHPRRLEAMRYVEANPW